MGAYLGISHRTSSCKRRGPHTVAPTTLLPNVASSSYIGNVVGTNMKAVVYRRYGPPDVLELDEVATPTPKPNEVRIKLRAATVTLGDCELRRREVPNLIWLIVRLFFGLIRPRKKVLGAYFAGDIDAVGAEVTRFSTGERVFACSGAAFGAYAEYICLPEDGVIAVMPAASSYAEAAAVPLALDSLHYLRLANIQAGERVLVNGAGGSMGIFAVQLAKYFGAEVTAVDSTAKLAELRALGADRVIDYTQEDFARDGEVYDVIFDVVCKGMYFRSIRALRSQGRYLIVNPSGLSQMLRGLWTSAISRKNVFSRFSSYNRDDLMFLKQRIDAGELKSVLDNCYRMDQIAEAHRYVETGQKIGNVVIMMDNANHHGHGAARESQAA